jgi:hypothetical protein
MEVKKIIFLRGTPPTDRDLKRLGRDILKKNGFEVWFYDFSPIVFPKLHQNCTFPDLYKGKEYALFSNMDEALKAISEISPDSLMIVSLMYGPATHKIFQTISKANIPYCVLAVNSLPFEKEKESSRILKCMKRLLSLNIDKVKKILYHPRFAHLWGIRSPNFCIVANELLFKKNKVNFLIGKNTEALWAHALDYDIYLEKSAEEVKTTSSQSVFLDQLAPMFQGDALALSYQVFTTVENYYPSMCKFFDHVEKQLDIKVEIAAHPKSNHPSYPEYYGGRKTSRGMTFEMLKNSRLAMTLCSTAIHFAILLKKPIIFLTTNEQEKDKRLSLYNKALAHSLGKTVINIDDPFNINWERELYVDEKIYDDYIDRYIKKRGSEELNTWQILANRLKRLQC